MSPLLTGTMNSLLSTLSVKDSSMYSLALIRALHNLNRYWGSLYDVSLLPRSPLLLPLDVMSSPYAMRFLLQMITYKPVVPPIEFISSKLTAKANRQLQDPLVIMTGNIPQWLPQVLQLIVPLNSCLDACLFFCSCFTVRSSALGFWMLSFLIPI